jgi:hypothetical protein
MQSGAGGSGGFDDSTGLDAVRAYDHLPDPPVVERAHALKIGIESSFADVVGMAHMVAPHRFFTTYIAYLGHDLRSLFFLVRGSRLTL